MNKKYNKSKKRSESTEKSDDLLNTLDIENIEKKNMKKLKRVICMAIIPLCIVIAIVGFTKIYSTFMKGDKNNSGTMNTQENGENQDNMSEVAVSITPTATVAPTPSLTPEEVEKQREEKERIEKEKQVKEDITAIIEKADLLASGYDYDLAIKEIQSFSDDYTQYNELTSAITGYKAAKDKLDPFGAYDSPSQISHIFFHSLIADTQKAFDGDRDSNGYNYYMTTVSEFNEMMLQMYNAGYVLVSIHDVAKFKESKDGNKEFVSGDIMLPPDKKPFVLSQDDVNYYNYMDGDGFASRVVIDENGRPSTEMILEDGSTKTGDYDMIPALETFITAHPDFSYKGARGIIAETGYEGTLGYRTDNTKSPTYEKDKKTVKKIVKVLKEYGWEFASHSYGHRDMQSYDLDFIKSDTDRWQKEVGSLVGRTDIFVYPYGIDIETGGLIYSSAKYKYLKKSGFNYFCGVYKDPWIQISTDYVRMTRRPLDGQAMLQFPDRLKDLFDLSKVIDPSRPKLK